MSSKNYRYRLPSQTPRLTRKSERLLKSESIKIEYEKEEEKIENKETLLELRSESDEQEENKKGISNIKLAKSQTTVIKEKRTKS